MGSGPGNKPSHGGRSYKSGATVVTVLLFSLSLSMFLWLLVSVPFGALGRGESRLRAGGARAKRVERAKGSGRDGQPVYESKKRVAVRAERKRIERESEKGVSRNAQQKQKRVTATEERGKGIIREKRNGGARKGKEDEGEGREPQHREPSYWNLNNNYSV